MNWARTGLFIISVYVSMTSECFSQCYSNRFDRIALFSPFLNSNPRVKKKIPTEYFGDSSAKSTRKCNGRGIVHTGNGYYLEFGEPVFAPISGIVHIYTLGNNELANNTRTGIWIEGKNITINFQGIQPSVADGQYIYKGQSIGAGFDNYGEAGVYFTIRNAPAQNPTVKRSFLPMVENSSTPCKCNNEPVFPEYFINPETREIDYNEFNEVQPGAELSVNIEPSGVGLWSFDSGETWQSSGAIIRGLPFSYFRIIFKNEFGYLTPAPMDYKLQQSSAAVILNASYTPDYSILPLPRATLEKEKQKLELSQRFNVVKDSIEETLRLKFGALIQDTLQELYANANSKILDSLDKRYNSLEEIQKNHLAIAKIFKYLLPLILILLVALMVYYVQNRKINRQKKTLELMQTEQHHRVYNNLGIIAGLVFDYGKDIGESKISELRNSILSIAKVHSQLYKGESLEVIELNDLFKEIGTALILQANVQKKAVIDVDCMLKIKQVKSTKLALIFNELVTNSLKYSNCEELKITVGGYRDENSNEVVLHYKDNGKGYETIPDKASEGMGIGIVLCFGLAKELGADVRFYNDKGAACIIRFKP